MNKTQYFFLMLKQGIKGVFRFKAQFTIILILSFLATFILSISISTARRIQDSYDQIVTKVDPFTFEAEFNVGQNADNSGGERTSLIPFLEVNNNDFAATYTNKDNMDDAITRYNFILSRPETYEKRQKDLQKGVHVSNHKNFVTQTYNKPEFIKFFVQDLLHDNDDDTTLTDKQKDEQSKRWLGMQNELLHSLLTDLDLISNNKPSIDDNLKYTPVGYYTTLHPFWYQEFVVKDTNGHYQFATWFPKASLKERMEHNDKNQFEYFYSLLQMINSVIYYFSNVQKELDPYFLESTDNLMTDAQLYAIIFGEKAHENDADINPNWLINEDGSNQYSIWFETWNSKNDYVFLNKNTDDDKITDPSKVDPLKFILKNGLKGITAPMLNPTYDAPNDWNTVLPVDYSYMLALTKGTDLFVHLDNFRDFYKYRTDFFDYLSIGILSGSGNVATFFRIMNKLHAEIFDYQFNMRREVTYFHSISTTSYRGIVIDPDENYNFTVLKGQNLVPWSQTNDVLISEQFATNNKHRIKPGDSVSIGNGTFQVVGYGTDAFSFVPSQDRLNPLPNPAISGFVYGSADALKRIWESQGENGAIGGQVTQTFNMFYWDQGPKKTQKLRLNAFFAAYSPTNRKLNLNQKLLQEYFANNGIVSDSTAKIQPELSVFGPRLTDFADSNYRYSWTIAPMVIKLLLIVIGIASGIIILIVLAALVICVKKTIQFNAKQIGILKAMGSSPAQIAISYISYSIIISLIIIPVAWIVGTILQIPFALMFQTYFSIVPDMIFFDWIPFVIAFATIGVAAGIIGYVSAYMITNTSVMKILANPIKWHNSKLLNWVKIKPLRNAKFKFRFSITLASAGSYQIWLMAIVLLVTSILVTVSLVIPSVVETSNRLFYRNVHYSNKYNEMPLTYNAPLSKSSISYWEGHDALEADYVGLNPNDERRITLDGSGEKYGYYNHLDSYYATISNSLVIPQYLYQKDSDTNSESLVNTLLFMAQNNDVKLLNYLTDIFGNSFYNNVGNGFSIGMIDALYGIIIHSIDSFVDGQNESWTDDDKLSYAQDFSSWLTSSIPDLINAIIGSTKNDGGDNSGEEVGNTWKDQIMGVLYGNLPSYVRQYVQRNDSRLDQYAISYQSEIYIPEKETLTTTVDGSISDKNIPSNSISLSGLDKNQIAIEITDTQKDNVYLPINIINKISDVLNTPNYASNISHKGMKIYDAQTKTLTLPILPNRQAEARYQIKSNSTLHDFTNTVQGIEFFNERDNKYMTLPKGAWIYDDTSYVNVAKNDPNFEFENLTYKDKQADETKQMHYYLDPYDLNNNKFSFKSEYQLDDQSKDTNKLINNAYLFKDFVVKDGVINSIYTRPYYQYKDLKLYFPSSYIIGLPNFLYPHGKDVLDPNDPNKDNNDSWYKVVGKDYVPETVKNAWNNPTTDDYLVISPYDLKYYNSQLEKNIQDEKVPALNNLLDHPVTWYNYANFGGEKAPLKINNNIQQTFANKDLKINLKPVGTIVSFNDNLVVIDSDLANLLMGLPITRQYQYNYTPFDDQNPILPNQADDSGFKDSQFIRYRAKQESFREVKNDDSFWKPRMTKYQANLKAEDYAPHNWYNGKLSMVDEPLSYSTTISYSGYNRLGLYLIGTGAWNGLDVGALVESSTLLAEQQALMNQITTLAISVGALLIVAIILTASLLVMLVGDIYIAQYRQFMVLMKALGYSNTTIMGYSLGTMTVIAGIMLAGGHAIGWSIIAIAINVLDHNGIALPFGFNWWVIPAFILVMCFSYFISLTVSSAQARHDPPTKILAQTNE